MPVAIENLPFISHALRRTDDLSTLSMLIKILTFWITFLVKYSDWLVIHRVRLSDGNFCIATVPSLKVPNTTKMPLHILSKSLSLHCTQINRVANKANAHPLSLLAYIQFSDDKAFTPMHLVLLQLNTHHCHLVLSSLMKTAMQLFQKYSIYSY